MDGGRLLAWMAIPMVPATFAVGTAVWGCYQRSQYPWAASFGVLVVAALFIALFTHNARGTLRLIPMLNRDEWRTVLGLNILGSLAATTAFATLGTAYYLDVMDRRIQGVMSTFTVCVTLALAALIAIRWQLAKVTRL